MHNTRTHPIARRIFFPVNRCWEAPCQLSQDHREPNQTQQRSRRAPTSPKSCRPPVPVDHFPFSCLPPTHEHSTPMHCALPNNLAYYPTGMKASKSPAKYQHVLQILIICMFHHKTLGSALHTCCRPGRRTNKAAHLEYIDIPLANSGPSRG
jgi:hypothetical protein